MNEKDLKFFTECPYLARAKVYGLEHAGVKFIDSRNVYIGENVEVGAGTIIWPNVYLLGDTKIGENCELELSIIEDSIVGDETFIGISSRISNSYVGKNCKLWGVRMNQSEVGDDCTLNATSRLLWTTIGKRCKIRPYCNLEYAKVGNDCELKSVEVTNAFIGKRARVYRCRVSDAKIYHDCVIEEGAWIHDNSLIGPHCEISRAEIVRSTLGARTKAKHCSYIGDVKMGCECNVGAGTVFGNYDGKEKHRCEMGDDVFIGINTSIINKSAKRIGNESFIGAHMLVREPVEDNVAIAPERTLVRPIRWSRKDKDGWELTQLLPSKKPKSKNEK